MKAVIYARYSPDSRFFRWLSGKIYSSLIVSVIAILRIRFAGA